MSTGYTAPPLGDVSGTPVFTAADHAWYEHFEAFRASQVAESHASFFLGGSLQSGPDGTAWEIAINGQLFQVPASKYGGFVYVAKILLVCEDAAVTITPRIYNLTDASVAVTGTACSGTDAAAFTGTNQKQTLSFTPTVAKDYILQFQKSANTKWCAGIGHVQRTEA